MGVAEGRRDRQEKRQRHDYTMSTLAEGGSRECQSQFPEFTSLPLLSVFIGEPLAPLWASFSIFPWYPVNCHTFIGRAKLQKEQDTHDR